MSLRPIVGVLAFQGDFAKHREAFTRLKCDVRLIKTAAQLSSCDYLVIPGGESSVIDRFIKSTSLTEPIKDFAQTKPVWGTCAGMILLASQVVNDNAISPLSLIDISVERNGYGRQFESFVDTGEFLATGKNEPLEMVFIRAPKITAIGAGVEPLGSCRGETVIVQSGHILASSFHPELTNSTRLQEHFLSLR